MELSGSINVSFEVKNDCLFVEASGRSDNFISLIELGIAVYKKSLETQARYHLLDYSKLELSMKWTDSFNLIRMYENSMPEFKHVTAACTFNDSAMEFVKYWQEIGQRRGYDIHIFPTREAAEKWLIEKASESRNSAS